MARGNVDVKIRSSFDDTGMKRAEGAMGRLNKAGKSSFGALTKHALGYSAALIGGAGVVGGLEAVVHASIDAEASQAKVRKATENAGLSWKTYGERIDKALERQSLMSGFMKTDVQDAFANMIRTTGDVNQAIRLNAVAMDIARTKGTGLVQAQSILARVYNGSFIGLKRLGIGIEPVTKAQDALRESTKHATVEQTRAAKAEDKRATVQRALALVQQKFSGQAKAYGHTTAGSLDRMREAVNLLEVRLGKALSPTIQKVANSIGKFVLQMREGTGAGGHFVKRIGDLRDFLEKLRPVLHAIAKGVSLLITVFGFQVRVILKLEKALIGLYETIVDKILGAFSSMLDAIGSAAKAASHLPVIGGAFGKVGDAAHAAANKINGVRDALKNLEGKSVDVNINLHEAVFGTGGGGFAGINKPAYSTGGGGFAGLNKPALSTPRPTRRHRPTTPLGPPSTGYSGGGGVGGGGGGGGGSGGGGKAWRSCFLTWYDPALGGINSGDGSKDPHHPTASGEPYQPNANTCAAPPAYSFGTMIEFKVGDRSVVCRVNDRGGAIQGNHFDLARGPAQYLGVSATNGMFRIAGRGSGGGTGRGGKPKKKSKGTYVYGLGYVPPGTNRATFPEMSEQALSNVPISAGGTKPKPFKPTVDKTLNNPWIQAALDHIDHKVAAGDMTEAEGNAAKTKIIQGAIDSGKLSSEDVIVARGMIRSYAPEAPLTGIEAIDKQFGDIDLHVRAGDITPAEGLAQKRGILEEEIAHPEKYGLSAHDVLELRADLGDLKDSIDNNNQLLEQQNALLQQQVDDQKRIAATLGTELGASLKAVADLISGQIGGYPGYGGRALTAGAGSVYRS